MREIIAGKGRWANGEQSTGGIEAGKAGRRGRESGKQQTEWGVWGGTGEKAETKKEAEMQ